MAKRAPAKKTPKIRGGSLPGPRRINMDEIEKDVDKSAIDALNDMQRAFLYEYMIDLNAYRACIRAGYSEKTADSQSSRLLAHPKIQRAFKEIVKIRNAAAFMDAANLIERMLAPALYDFDHLFDIDDKGQPTLNLNKAGPREKAAITAVDYESHQLGPEAAEKMGYAAEPMTITRAKVRLVDRAAVLDKVLTHITKLPGQTDPNAMTPDRAGDGARSKLAELMRISASGARDVTPEAEGANQD